MQAETPARCRFCGAELVPGDTGPRCPADGCRQRHGPPPDGGAAERRDQGARADSYKHLGGPHLGGA